VTERHLNGVTLRLVESRQSREQLVCAEAERAISLQLDRELPRHEAARLLVHLRSCPACAALARQQHLQREALRRLAVFARVAPPAFSAASSRKVPTYPTRRRA
jgi:predicted anti-sigma-YlaC factor YlaD